MPRKDDATTKELQSYVDRIVALEEQRHDLAADVKDIYQTAKDRGWSIKALRQVVKRRLEDDDARADREATEIAFDAMMRALGLFADTPLGEAAVATVGARKAATKRDADPASAIDPKTMH